MKNILDHLARPGTALMRRLSLQVKLTAIGLLATLPLAAIAWQFMTGLHADYRLTQRELAGVAVNLALIGLTPTGDMAAQRNAAADLDKLLQDPAAALLRGRWQGLRQRLDGQSGQVEPDELAELLLINGETFGLLFEPDPAMYLAVDLSTERLLGWWQSAHRLGQDGIAAGDPVIAGPALAALASAQGKVLLQTDAMRRVGGTPPPELTRALADGAAVLAAAAGANGRVDAAAARKLAGAMHEAQLAVARHLQAGLQARVEALGTAMVLETGGCLLALVLLVYAMWCFQRATLDSVAEVRRVVSANADGNLAVQAQVTGRDTIAQIARDLGRMNADLSGMVGQIRSEAVRVTMAGEAIAARNRELSDRTERAAANLEQTAASVQQLDESVRQNATSAVAAGELAVSLRGQAEEGTQSVAKAVQTMAALQATSSRMGEIIGAIDAIAFQTNILALNAAVEAARAGEQGRGFAVVAAEVRALAQRSGESARQVRALIDESHAEVELGSNDIQSVQRALEDIAGGIREMAQRTQTIAESSTAQSRSLGEISGAVGDLDRITQDNAAMVESTLQSAEALRQRSGNLAQAVSSLRLRRATADEAHAMTLRALELVRREGLAAAKPALHDQLGQFRDRDLYVFAFDRNGLFTVYGADPSKAGNTTVHQLPGLDGKHLHRAGWEAAGRGGDWVEYDVTSPVSGQVEPKMTYIVQADDNHVLGCGVYKPVLRPGPVPSEGPLARSPSANARTALTAKTTGARAASSGAPTLATGAS